MGGTPAAQRPAPAPAPRQPTYTGGAHIAGGTPSGGWPAQHSGGGTGGSGGGDENRTPLLVAIGVVGGILAILAVALLLRGGGDDENGADDNTTDSSEQTASNSNDAYDDGDKAAFVSGCTSPPEGETAGLSEAVCDCAWGRITSEVPFEEFADYDQAVADANESGEAAPAMPESITAAITPCLAEASA